MSVPELWLLEFSIAEPVNGRRAERDALHLRQVAQAWYS
jgi:hypothetical protein